MHRNLWLSLTATKDADKTALLNAQSGSSLGFRVLLPAGGGEEASVGAHAFKEKISRHLLFPSLNRDISGQETERLSSGGGDQSDGSISGALSSLNTCATRHGSSGEDRFSPAVCPGLAWWSEQEGMT